MTKILNFGSRRELYKYARKEPSGCWEWQKSLIDGYGQVVVNGRLMAAHRYSYLISIGPLEPGKLICHNCDNRRCIRPSHLFQGTHRDNMDDMISKGRSPNNTGLCNPNRKLTQLAVGCIRDIGHSRPYVETAREFDVTPEMISLIVRGKYWRAEV